MRGTVLPAGLCLDAAGGQKFGGMQPPCLVGPPQISQLPGWACEMRRVGQQAGVLCAAPHLPFSSLLAALEPGGRGGGGREMGEAARVPQPAGQVQCRHARLPSPSR